MVVDDQSEISFLMPQGSLPCQSNFVSFSARVSQVASGAAGWANIGLCSASSLSTEEYMLFSHW